MDEKSRAVEEFSKEKIRILIVDNHAMFRQSLRELLKSQEDMVVVAEAEDGEASVRLAEELSPDVILMDINMPGMNGIHATRAIRSRLPDSIVIGLSMFDAADMAEEMIGAGACGYIEKSGVPEALFEAIRTSCRKRRNPD